MTVFIEDRRGQAFTPTDVVLLTPGFKGGCVQVTTSMIKCTCVSVPDSLSWISTSEDGLAAVKMTLQGR